MAETDPATVGEDVVLVVPSEYARDFREALLRDIAFEAAAVDNPDKEISGAVAVRDDQAAVLRRDQKAMLPLLVRDARLLAQLDEQRREGRLRLEAEPATLAGVLELMAREVVGARLARLLERSPIDAGTRDELGDLAGTLTWAVGHAAELNGQPLVGPGGSS